jgi:uncharacterized protein
MMMSKTDVLKMKISRVEKEIRDTPYHKGTQHHIGRLRAKLAHLRDQVDGVGGKGGGGSLGYGIAHQGDATIVLVGPPSAGKSTLLNKLSSARSKIGAYDFTTIGVVPGMMEIKGAKIQVLDLPGILLGAAENKGFGKKVLSVARGANLMVLISDTSRPEWLLKIEEEIYKTGIRINQEKPKIEIRKALRGSIRVIDPYNNFPIETVSEVAEEFGIKNAEVRFGEKVDNLDKLIDVFAKSRVYMKAIKVLNKGDIKKLAEQGVLLISAEKDEGIESLKEEIWDKLELVRVYLKKERSKEADKKEPLIMKKSQTFLDVLDKISGKMREGVKVAYIWGKGARFPGQKVSLKKEIFDEVEVFFGR